MFQTKEKLQILQQKTKNLPTIKMSQTNIYKSTNKETTWIPPRTVDVSNFIQLDAIINR